MKVLKLIRPLGRKAKITRKTDAQTERAKNNNERGVEKKIFTFYFMQKYGKLRCNFNLLTLHV